MPEFEGVEEFPGPTDDLHRYKLSDLGGFLFSAIDPASDLFSFVGSPKSVFDEFNGHQMKLTETRDYTVNCHWALYCENYLEGFHIPYVRKSLNEIVDFGTYSTETHRFSSMQIGYDREKAVAGRYLFIFPNLMFNFYPWGISVNIVEPVTPDRSRVRFLSYVADESKLQTGAGGDLDRVELEDEAVVESVQKGIRSRSYDRGRYSPTREQGTHHFHRLIAEFMN
jgi:choline monooxygenase